MKKPLLRYYPQQGPFRSEYEHNSKFISKVNNLIHSKKAAQSKGKRN